MNSKHQHIFLTRWLTFILWLGVIYYFSSLPDLRSGFATDWDLLLRKAAHMVEFAILAVLGVRVYPESGNQGRAILFGIVAAFLFAVADEWHQSFVAGRLGSWRDVGVDSVGILLGAAAYDRWLARRNPRKS